ncbi:GH1 family beta-glucosidase [Rhizomonospora bruguierae]|uniref:GH1 family beta-glucosidase n=1 Tax=Rhizomonospora bruguierae TaxID=1581705 RepID=UPI001BD09F2F|nr:GH1 family beta-glucosidase [Micromonospora sp. NBRC 107566]
MAVDNRRHQLHRAPSAGGGGPATGGDTAPTVAAPTVEHAPVLAATTAAVPLGSPTPAALTTPAPNGSGEGADGHRTPDPLHEPHLGLRFPDGFGWGAATSAYQIEGASKEDGRGESVWDTFSRTPGKVANGDTGDVAADHYHRYVEDLNLMKELGLRSYRFSISWSRVLPDGSGQVNQRGLDFYRRLVDGLHERNIQPMATLFHWDLPQVLHDAGGWENRDTAYRFADYADLVYRALGDQVPTWLTVNEPKTVVQNGYLRGSHAPGFADADRAYLAAHHLQLAHGLAVRAMRATGIASRIGPALNLHPCYPADQSAESRAATELYDGYENRLYLDSILRGHYPQDVLDDLGPGSPMVRAIQDGDLELISAPVDLLAVQYYTPIYVTAAGEITQKWPTSMAFWQQIYPDGMYDILTRVTRDYGAIPLTITENGLPCPDQLDANGAVDDPSRVAFLRDHLAATHRAIADGVPLESYHVWSLLDNFEWECGYEQRWGLIYVDYASQQRIFKRSAHWYRQVIANNAV